MKTFLHDYATTDSARPKEPTPQCDTCKYFDACEGWCKLHNSAQWPDQSMCRLGESL